MFHNTDILEKIGISRAGGDQPERNTLEDQDWFIQKKQHLENFWVLLVELASARSWSQSLYVSCWPHNLVSVLHQDHGLAQQVMDRNNKTWTAILKAETLIHDPAFQKKMPAIAKGLNERLSQIDWHEWQFSRELYLESCKANWKISNMTLRSTAFDIFGSPANTKYDLEDVFSHMAALSKFLSKATPMNKSLGNKKRSGLFVSGSFSNTIILSQFPSKDIVMKSRFNSRIP